MMCAPSGEGLGAWALPCLPLLPPTGTQDLAQLNPHFGTAQDLLDMLAAYKEQGGWVGGGLTMASWVGR